MRNTNDRLIQEQKRVDTLNAQNEDITFANKKTKADHKSKVAQAIINRDIAKLNVLDANKSENRKYEELALDRKLRIELQTMAGKTPTPQMKNALAAMDDPALDKKMKEHGLGTKNAAVLNKVISSSWHRTMKSWLGDQGGGEMPNKKEDWATMKNMLTSDLAGEMGLDSSTAEIYADIILKRAGADMSGGTSRGTAAFNSNNTEIK